MKISVIVPCYNMKTYLSECLESILNQSIKDLEIICIDDGSRDGSRAFLKEYEKKYSNVRVFHQSNRGQGDARNRGIKSAQGEYIAFLDADDFYPDADILETLYNVAVKYNANICGGSVCSYRNGVYTYAGFRRGMVFDEDGWISRESFPTFAGFWRFLFRRCFLLENNIFFPNYLRNEDPPFFLKAVSKSENIYCIKKITYCYRKEHKQVHFEINKAIDYIKGIIDCLLISKDSGMNDIYASFLNELHGESTALMYYFAYEGSQEMNALIHDINLIIKKDVAENQLLYEGNNLKEYMEQVWIERDKFFSILNQYPIILIFGAGTVGRKVLNFLRVNRYEPDAFIVSDLKQNPQNVEGVDVKTIIDYVDIRKNCFIIVATFSYLHKEIQNILLEKGFENNYLIDLEKFYLWCGGVVH